MTYPGDEVRPVETITLEQAIAKHGKDTLRGPDVLYIAGELGTMQCRLTIVERTGRTSLDWAMER